MTLSCSSRASAAAPRARPGAATARQAARCGSRPPGALPRPEAHAVELVERSIALYVDDAEQLVAVEHRDGEFGAGARHARRPYVARIGRDVVDELRAPRPRRGAHDPAADRQPFDLTHALLVLAAADPDHQRLRVGRLDQRYVDAREAEQLVDRVRGALQQRVELGLARDDAGDARDHCETGRAALLVAVAPRVDDCDGRVTRKMLEQLLFGIAELLGRPHADTEYADQLAAAHDRHADHAHVFRRGRGWDAADRHNGSATASQLEYATGQAVTAGSSACSCAVRDRMARRSADDVALGHVQTDRAIVRADQLARPLDEPREQRLERELAGNVLDHLRQQFQLRADVGVAGTDGLPTPADLGQAGDDTPPDACVDDACAGVIGRAGVSSFWSLTSTSDKSGPGQRRPGRERGAASSHAAMGAIAENRGRPWPRPGIGLRRAQAAAPFACRRSSRGPKSWREVCVSLDHVDSADRRLAALTLVSAPDCRRRCALPVDA